MKNTMNIIFPEAPAAAGDRPKTHALEMPPLLWGADGLAAAKPGGWLRHGCLAAGAVTLLTSQWKAGKTTLVSVLLARM